MRNLFTIRIRPKQRAGLNRTLLLCAAATMIGFFAGVPYAVSGDDRDHGDRGERGDRVQSWAMGQMISSPSEHGAIQQSDDTRDRPYKRRRKPSACPYLEHIWQRSARHRRCSRRCNQFGLFHRPEHGSSFNLRGQDFGDHSGRRACLE